MISSSFKKLIRIFEQLFFFTIQNRLKKIIYYTKKVKTIYHIRLLFLIFDLYLLLFFFLSKQTALMWESRNGRVEVVQTLCEHDADLNIQDKR